MKKFIIPTLITATLLGISFIYFNAKIKFDSSRELKEREVYENFLDNNPTTRWLRPPKNAFRVFLNLHNDLDFIGSKVLPKFYPSAPALQDFTLFSYHLPRDHIFAPCRDRNPVEGKLVRQSLFYPLDKDSINFRIGRNGRIITRFDFDGDIYQSNFLFHWNKNSNRPSNCLSAFYTDWFIQSPLKASATFSANINQTFYLRPNNILASRTHHINIDSVKPTLSGVIGDIIETIISGLISTANIALEIVNKIFELWDGSDLGILSEGLGCTTMTDCTELFVKATFFWTHKSTLERDLEELINSSLNQSIRFGSNYHSPVANLNYNAFLNRFETLPRKRVVRSDFLFDLSVTSPPSECAQLVEKPDFDPGKVNNPYEDDISLELDLNLFNIVIYSMVKAGFLCHEIELSKKELLGPNAPNGNEKVSLFFSPVETYDIFFDQMNNKLVFVFPMVFSGLENQISTNFRTTLTLSFELLTDCNNGLVLNYPNVSLSEFIGSTTLRTQTGTFNFSSNNLSESFVEQINLSIKDRIESTIGDKGVVIIPKVTGLGDVGLYLHLRETFFQNNVIVNSFSVEDEKPDTCVDEKDLFNVDIDYDPYYYLEYLPDIREVFHMLNSIEDQDIKPRKRRRRR